MSNRLVELIFAATLLYTSPAQSLITEQDLFFPAKATGWCQYRGYQLKLDCHQGSGCYILEIRDGQGNKASLPPGVRLPLVKYNTKGVIIECLDPPAEKYTSPQPKERRAIPCC